MAAHTILVYDGHCGSCGWFARLVKSLDSEDQIELRTLQDREVEAKLRPRLGDGYEASFHLLDESTGEVQSGEKALPALARLLPAVAPFAQAGFSLPLVRRFPGFAYRAAAAARACALPGTRA